MKIKLSILTLTAVLINLSACSTIKTYFPDKERDYQFTTEIPPLILPPDLAVDSLVKTPVPVVAPPVEALQATHAKPQIDEVPAVDPKSIKVALIDAEQGTKRLQINAPSITAWRMVGKALSRKNLEVTDRNQEKAFFHVQFDPNKQPVEDDSFFDEVAFLFKGFVSEERKYILKLSENNGQTDVIILDKDEKPIADEASLSLLTLLHNTIKADLSAKK